LREALDMKLLNEALDMKLLNEALTKGAPLPVRPPSEPEAIGAPPMPPEHYYNRADRRAAKRAARRGTR
jgi:hypothetical protein